MSIIGLKCVAPQFCASKLHSWGVMPSWRKRHDTYLTRKEMFICLVKLKTNPTHDTTPRMVGKPKASPQAIELLMHASRGGRFSGLLPG